MVHPIFHQVLYIHASFPKFSVKVDNHMNSVCVYSSQTFINTYLSFVSVANTLSIVAFASPSVLGGLECISVLSTLPTVKCIRSQMPFKAGLRLVVGTSLMPKSDYIFETPNQKIHHHCHGNMKMV